MTVAVGVLALQGDFEAHVAALKRLGLPARPVRTAEEVRALVRRRIDQMIALGTTPIGVGRAEVALSLADARLDAGEYRGAFKQLCRAYKQLQLSRR